MDIDAGCLRVRAGVGTPAVREDYVLAELGWAGFDEAYDFVVGYFKESGGKAGLVGRLVCIVFTPAQWMLGPAFLEPFLDDCNVLVATTVCGDGTGRYPFMGPVV